MPTGSTATHAAGAAPTGSAPATLAAVNQKSFPQAPRHPEDLPPSAPPAHPGTPAGTVARGGGPAADREAVLLTLRTYLISIGRGDGTRACAQFTPAGRRRKEVQIWKLNPALTSVPCEESIQMFAGAYGTAIRDPHFTDLEVTSGRATATGPAEEKAVLLEQGRLWRIVSYGGS